MWSLAPRIASNMAWKVAGPSCSSTTLLPTTRGAPTMASSSARWRSKMLVSCPRLESPARMALLCCTDRRPRAPSSPTGRDERSAMSGTMVGSTPQLASVASARIADIFEIMRGPIDHFSRWSMLGGSAGKVCAVSNEPDATSASARDPPGCRDRVRELVHRGGIRKRWFLVAQRPAAGGRFRPTHPPFAAATESFGKPPLTRRPAPWRSRARAAHHRRNPRLTVPPTRPQSRSRD